MKSPDVLSWSGFVSHEAAAVRQETYEMCLQRYD